MTDFELSLPKDERLNQLLHPAGYLYDNLISEIRELQKSDSNGDVIDIAREVSTAEDYAAQAEILCELMFHDRAGDTFESIYRALTFYRQTVAMIYGDGNNLMNQAPYLIQMQPLTPSERYRMLWNDVTAYFKENPEIEAFVLDHTSQIDEERGKHAQVYLTGGYVFMLSERTQGQKFMDEQAVALLDGIEESFDD